MATVDFIEDVITRIVAQCKEAVPESKKTFDYLLSDYASFPHWRVGETEYVPSTSQTEKLTLTVTIQGRLYGGKLAKGYKGSDGTAEKLLRPLLPRAAQFFYSHLRLTSNEIQGLPSGYAMPQGITLAGPRKVIDDSAEDGNLLYGLFTWTIPVLVPREVR